MAHLQGPVPLADNAYVKRPFENELHRELMANRWVLLLGPRQHGKTSALVRLQRALSENRLAGGARRLAGGTSHPKVCGVCRMGGERGP